MKFPVRTQQLRHPLLLLTLLFPYASHGWNHLIRNPVTRTRQQCHPYKPLQAEPTTSKMVEALRDSPEDEEGIWKVYIDQSKVSLDRGGAATLDAFLGLSPPHLVNVRAVQVLPSSDSSSTTAVSAAAQSAASASPRVRCYYDSGSTHKSLEIANVDSVDKVYRILTKHLLPLMEGNSSRIPSPLISYKACECLKWRYKGNGHLEGGQLDAAVEAYNNALEILEPSVSPFFPSERQQQEQEGILLQMRASAHLQRAASHKLKLKQVVGELMAMVPPATKLEGLFQTSRQSKKTRDKSGTETYAAAPAFSNAIFRRVMQDTARQQESCQRAQYWHGLYQYALLQAAQDALKATQYLPKNAQGWSRAGEILSELWKLKESAQYYETAIQLEPDLRPTLQPVIDRLFKQRQLLESARIYGWSEDTLRLALDVAG